MTSKQLDAASHARLRHVELRKEERGPHRPAVVFAGSAEVVGKQVIVGNLVPLLGMIPEPADIFDELAVVVDEGIVQGNDALVAVFQPVSMQA